MSDLRGWLRRAGHLLTPITPGAKRAVVVLFLLSFALAAVNSWFTASEVDRLRGTVLASCAFAADVGSAPVATGPGGKASELGVSIVADSRAQWRRLGCPGHLAPPQPSFVRWARYYHLDARLWASSRLTRRRSRRRSMTSS